LQVKTAIETVDGGAGALMIVKNYTGDVLNFSIAGELLADRHRIATVVVDDDLATATPDDGGPGRRGTAAVVAVEKVCGAAAESGASLDEVAALGTEVVRRSATLGIAFAACTNPLTGRRSFELEPGQIEYGVGIHGERGTGTRPTGSADELVESLLTPISEHLGISRGDEVLVIVNGLGSTHQLELALAMRAVADQLGGRGVGIARNLVGSYVTSLDMHGFSITVAALEEDHLKLWDAPVTTPALTW
jgi:dihydroxyacetone kinase-like protein